MTSTISDRGAAEQAVTKHPVRGAIWGLLLGVGLAMYAILFAVIPFTDWIPLLLVVLVGVAIGVAWAFLAPAKQPKTAPPEPAPSGAGTAATSVPAAGDPIEDASANVDAGERDADVDDAPGGGSPGTDADDAD